jgi:hypothetical protein
MVSFDTVVVLMVIFYLRAFNEVKATSRAHDKKVSLNTSRNYNVLQASKPWAPQEDAAALARGRGAPRGRGFRGRGGGRPGNETNPRNDFNSGGSDYGASQRPNRGRGSFNSNQRFPRGNHQQGQNRNNNNFNSGNNTGGSFQQKQRPQNNKSFRGGGN